MEGSCLHACKTGTLASRVKAGESTDARQQGEKAEDKASRRAFQGKELRFGYGEGTRQEPETKVYPYVGGAVVNTPQWQGEEEGLKVPGRGGRKKLQV